MAPLLVNGEPVNTVDGVYGDSSLPKVDGSNRTDELHNKNTYFFLLPGKPSVTAHIQKSTL